MASTTNGAQPKRARPQSVLPAIPLPYVRHNRQQQLLKEAAVALAKAKEEEALQTPIPPPAEEISPPTPQPAEASPSVVNGSSDRSSEKADETSVPTSPERVAESTPVGADQDAPVAQMEFMNIQEPISTPSETPSAGSRTTYQMPPPFVPANHSPHPSSTFNPQNPGNVESPRFPTFNGHHMHHGHPSTSSLVFGGYPESNNSSPAPLSAGHFPPPPFPPHGHHPHLHQSNGGFSHNGTNGFSPMGPPPGYYPRQDGFMNPPADFSRRQMAPFGPPEGYSPVQTPMGDPRVNAFDPLGPHSFHGSQSSAPAEVENAPPGFGYPVAAISNGTNGHAEEARVQQPPRQKNQALPHNLSGNGLQGNPNGQAAPMDHLDGLVQYLQSQFGDPGMSDCTLELRYSDDRSQPVRIPGHGLILARSPVLKELMSKQVQNDGYGRTLLLESDNPFLRSDGFWMAVQRLYGGPLLEPNVLATSAGFEHDTPEGQFGFALGYASAGIILQIPPVVARGMDFASRLVGWATVEKAVDFHLGGGLDSLWGNQSGPGPNSNALIHAATSFLITGFPPAFKLDSSVVDAKYNPRLPIVTGHNPRLSFIKFGDHPSQESVSTFTSNAITTTVSKILLKLPFPLLKYVLESSRLGNVSGWATATLRQEVMHAVISEREKRRLRVLASSVPNHDRKMREREWEVVGWQESVQPFDGNEETPTLQRVWVGFLGGDDQ